MTPTEFRTEVVEYIATRWAPGRAWSGEAPTRVYWDFQDIPVESARAGLRSLYEEGLQAAPSPSRVLKACRDELRRNPRAGEPRPCVDMGGHVWGILDEKPNHERLVQCARCGEGPEWRFVRTPGEIDRGDKPYREVRNDPTLDRKDTA